MCYIVTFYFFPTQAIDIYKRKIAHVPGWTCYNWHTQTQNLKKIQIFWYVVVYVMQMRIGARIKVFSLDCYFSQICQPRFWKQKFVKTEAGCHSFRDKGHLWESIAPKSAPHVPFLSNGDAHSKYYFLLDFTKISNMTNVYICQFHALSISCPRVFGVEGRGGTEGEWVERHDFFSEVLCLCSSECFWHCYIVNPPFRILPYWGFLLICIFISTCLNNVHVLFRFQIFLAPLLMFWSLIS